MSVANILQSASNFGKDHIVNFTKVLNNDANPGAVDMFIWNNAFEFAVVFKNLTKTYSFQEFRLKNKTKANV